MGLLHLFFDTEATVAAAVPLCITSGVLLRVALGAAMRWADRPGSE